MTARLILVKYTGKSGEFGTVVSSLGIKRTDWCVPATYSSAALGGKVIPADDASDCKTYCIYRPDRPDCLSYSFETAFKIKLDYPPDVQLSNLRLYPTGTRPDDVNQAVLRIGNSMTYSAPTSAKSLIAVNDIWSYNRDNPFYLTVAGNFGQKTDPRMDVRKFDVTFKDYGAGNVIYLNGGRQPSVPVGNPTDGGDISLTFVNRAYDASPAEFNEFIQFTDASGAVIDGASSGAVTTEGDVTTLWVRSASRGVDLFTKYPDGIFYRMPGLPGTGYMIYWVKFPETGSSAKTEETHNVTMAPDEHGCPVYYIDGARRPQINLDPSVLYTFRNTSGGKYPMRFIGNPKSPVASNPDDVIVDGINVSGGATDEETIRVNPEAVLMAGHCVGGYQCVCSPGMGNTVFGHPFFRCGNYNMCRVGGGVYNPMLAGESDYVYMQLEVSGKTTPGYCVPDIEIEYDEN